MNRKPIIHVVKGNQFFKSLPNADGILHGVLLFSIKNWFYFMSENTATELPQIQMWKMYNQVTLLVYSNKSWQQNIYEENCILKQASAKEKYIRIHEYFITSSNSLTWKDHHSMAYGPSWSWNNLELGVSLDHQQANCKATRRKTQVTLGFLWAT